MADTRSTSILGSALHDAGPGSLCGVELIPLTPSVLAAAATLEPRRRKKQAASDPPNRQALRRALEAAQVAGLVRSFAIEGDITHVTWRYNPPGAHSATTHAAEWLSEEIRSDGQSWQLRTTEEGWTSLLDAMSALAETMPWWKVAP